MAHTPSEKLLNLLIGCLTPEAATRLAALRVDAETQRQISDLAAKANNGQLSDEESSQYHQIVETMDFIAALQARAREMVSA